MKNPKRGKKAIFSKKGENIASPLGWNLESPAPLVSWENFNLHFVKVRKHADFD
jgi:hypothetical protein